MLTLVVVCNLLIAVINLYLAWRIWKIRRVLAQVTITLNNVERSIYNIFHSAPYFIYLGQKGTSNLRGRYQKLQVQLQRVQLLLTVLSLGLTVFRRQNRRGQFLSRRRRGFQ
ncbi:hypothetical protein [Oscillatoria salina]|uniref:hypothetical protein n=1 Tax=Oscillatoria salina TaxID=331517 RepID=UPI001CCC6D47|nr:hypothetical protein [Oscillatoria salina]MBZ8182261.1 hypothetical protein [Oscillatoria salina IIICB1]